jgi:hypothetical protein
MGMGAFANLHKYARDSVLKRLVQLVTTDEAFHHKFGKAWDDKTIASLFLDERDRVEGWVVECFESLLFNLLNVRQKTHRLRAIRPRLGMGARRGAGDL